MSEPPGKIYSSGLASSAHDSSGDQYSNIMHFAPVLAPAAFTTCACAPARSIKRMDSLGAKRHQIVHEMTTITRGANSRQGKEREQARCETTQAAAAERALRYPTAEEEQTPGLEDDAW